MRTRYNLARLNLKEGRIPVLSTCTENASSDRVVVFCKIIE